MFKPGDLIKAMPFFNYYYTYILKNKKHIYILDAHQQHSTEFDYVEKDHAIYDLYSDIFQEDTCPSEDGGPR